MTPFGEGAVRFAVPEGTDRRALFAELRALPGVLDVVLAETSGMVVGGDPSVIGARAAAAPRGPGSAGSLHVIEVVYDGEDLDAVASLARITRDDVVRAHTDREHTVAMLGFLPGFAYLRGVDPRLALGRRESPRTRVPRGSVAIAAGYTGIYPFASPGGWHLIGRAPRFRPFGPSGARLALGDRVRFTASDSVAAEPEPQPRARAASGPHLVVARVAGAALLVDGGRRGHMHEGVPPGGALIPEALARANAALGNPRDACGIEVYGSVTVAAAGAMAIADDRNGATVLRDGETATVATEGRVRARYVALPGGCDVPEVLGGRGTLLVAGIGGLEGRALRRGDTVAPLAAAGASAPGPTSLAASPPPSLPDPADEPIVVTLGPDPAPPSTIHAMLTSTFRISQAADRTGTRLDGPPLETDYVEHPSAPMICGAIELTPRGLIVLGPDHPTTGGYPVLAVLHHGSIGRFFAKPIGERVRFVAV